MRVCAGSLVERHGRRKAAAIATETLGAPISASTALRAHLAGGVQPRRRGRELTIPKEIEGKLEDLCIVLREMKLPLFRNMIMKYVNTLAAGTPIADKLKHKEVRRHWYYNWLRRCSRLTTGNLTPLEMSRAQWATAANAKKHYDLLAEIFVDATVATPNPDYNPDEPYSERLLITKPDRIFSMDETRLTYDASEKNKANKNRSIIVRGGGRDVLANKRGEMEQE
jgi:hypothetical protein